MDMVEHFDEIKKIKKYALENKVPIMMDDGIDFLTTFIIKNQIKSVLEIGTGSGCISVALKKEKEDLEITATDISIGALKIAKKNAKLNKCKITFIKQDVNKCKLFNNYDVLISNPPYLKETDVLDEKTRFEPHNALFGGKDGLKFYPVIFGVAKKYLNKKFLIALEIDEDNGKEIKALAKEAFPKAKVKLEKDLTGRDRYIFVINE